MNKHRLTKAIEVNSINLCRSGADFVNFYTFDIDTSSQSGMSANLTIVTDMCKTPYFLVESAEEAACKCLLPDAYCSFKETLDKMFALISEEIGLKSSIYLLICSRNVWDQLHTDDLDDDKNHKIGIRIWKDRK